MKDSAGLVRVKANLKRKQSLVANFMRSEAGQEIIRVLEEEFYDADLLGGDPYETYHKIGQRDVVLYLKQIANWKED